MCLILFAFSKHPKYKLVLAANRDEFFERPTLAADYWNEHKGILSGRDIKSGGTWLGINKNGKFAAITNYRKPETKHKRFNSRGALSKSFLTNDENVFTFLKKISEEKDNYDGFNLLLSDDGLNSIYHYSNVSDTTTKVTDGVHGLSNHLLDSAWPKIEIGKKNLKTKIQSTNIDLSSLFELLKDDRKADDESLPSTGISYDLEKNLSPVFISMKGYGTRCSTVMLLDHKNKLTFQEISYDENKSAFKDVQFKLTIAQK